MAKSLCHFNNIGKSYPSRKFQTLQICLLTLFAKIKFSRKFPDLQYSLFLVASIVCVYFMLDACFLLWFSVPLKFSNHLTGEDKLVAMLL